MLKDAFKVLNQMVKDGIIEKYAIGGGIGTEFYTEPLNTKDLDIFLYPQITLSGLVVLTDVFGYLKNKGYSEFIGQCLFIEGIPVDFVGVANELVAEAFKNTIEIDYDGVKVNVFKPEYLIAIALQVRRSQDLLKVRLLKEETDIDYELLNAILVKYGIKNE